MKNSAYLTLFCVCTVAQAASLVDPLYCSGMVVQREAPISVRGNGDFGQTVVARFANQEKAATVSTDGRWEVDLAPLPAGGPYELLVRSGKEEVRLNDVWVGDVWIASGQSNMELTLKDSTGGAEAAARPPEGTLRLWNVDKIVAHAPRDILQSAWKPGMAEAALNSSGVGYYFGRLLAERTNIPIGMVNASWGGTPIQSWTRTEVLSTDYDFVPILKRWEQTLRDYPAAKARWESVTLEQRQREFQQRVEEARAKGLPKVYPEWPPQGPDSPEAPAVLWNGMIHPLTHLPIKGVIWYQGESNAPYAEQYAKLFPAMIRDWRAQWGIGDFPFYFVQLCNFNAFRKQVPEPVESTWAELREAQAQTRDVAPNTGMAVTIDVGEADEIHPKDKKTVGQRLALLALKHVYGQQVVCEGPRYCRYRNVPRGVEVEFSDVAVGLKTREGSKRIRAFSVAGSDREFAWAEAEILGPSIILVKKPAGFSAIESVRYDWGDTPDGNLCSSAGLPAEPFRTDNWPGLTTGKR
jgi:sialate O-acetylesterase